jgi:hypothetical protein
MYGGRIRLVNRCRLPSTTRLSFTRGAFSANVPVPVVTGRGLADPVAHDQRAPLAVAILGEARDVVVGLHFQRRRDHAPRTLPREFVERVAKTEAIFLVLRLRVPTLAAFQYLEHRRAFPRRRACKLTVGVFWVWLPGKVRRFFRPSRSTTSGYISS